jgi:hypothetical protein
MGQPVHRNSDVFCLGMNMLTTWQNRLVVNAYDDDSDSAVMLRMEKFFKEDFTFWLLQHG